MHTGRVGLGLLLGWALLPTVGFAATAHVSGSSATACPDPLAVALEANKVLARTSLDTADTGRGLRFVVADRGPRYEITGAELSRTFDDPARNCAERARALAVFLALYLEPPVALRKPDRPPGHRLVADLEMAGLVDVTPANGVGVSGGATVRASFGSRYVRLVAGVTGLSPVELVNQGVIGRFVRVPFDIGIRGALRLGRVELLGDLEVAPVATHATGVNLVRNESGTRADLALRIALGVKVWFRDRIATFVACQTLVSPTPIDVSVTPEGVVGTTPRWWIGTLVGLSVRLY